MRTMLIFVSVILMTLAARAEVPPPPLVVMEMKDGTVEKPWSIAFVDGRFEVLGADGKRRVIQSGQVRTVRINSSYVELPTKLEMAQQDVAVLARLVNDLQTSMSMLRAGMGDFVRMQADKDREIAEKSKLIKQQEALIATNEARLREVQERAQRAEKLAADTTKELNRATRPPLETPEYTPSPAGQIRVQDPMTHSGQVKSMR